MTNDEKGGGAFIISGGETDEYAYNAGRINALNRAGMCALFALITLFSAGLFLLFPKFIWSVFTLPYRLFFEWDTSPTFFAVTARKVSSYVLFFAGVAAVIYGYYIFL